MRSRSWEVVLIQSDLAFRKRVNWRIWKFRAQEYWKNSSMKPLFALLSLALFIAVVTAGVPNDPSEMKAFSEASELIINNAGYERVVNSSEIIAKIQMGEPVTYDNVVIRGDLNLSDLDLPKTHIERTLPDIVSGLSENATPINSPIRINNSLIEGRLTFNNIIFNNSLNFVKSQFMNDFLIQGSEFKAYANFKGSEFSGISQFRNSWFKKDVCFSNVAFDNSVNFSDSRFDGDVAFVEAYFNSPTTFLDAKFNGEVHFTLSQFNRNVIFSSSNFGISWFNKYTDFSKVQFNESALFDNIYFTNTADFRDAEFYGLLSLESSQFSEDGLFQHATFGDMISLTRTKYNKFYISFDSIKDALEYDPAAYQLLIKNYNDLGFFDDANNCYFQFMKQQLKHRDPMESPLLFIFDFAAYVFYGYGVKVSYPMTWSLLTVVLFGGYWRKKGVDEPFRFSAKLFLSGSKLFFESPERAIEHEGSWLKDMFSIERLLGAAFTIMIFLTISKMILRG